MLGKDTVQFDRIYLEISNICNLQCTFCPVVERDKKIISIDEYRNFLLELLPLLSPSGRITMHVMGEPLAHPHFKELLVVASELKAPLEITTNGLLIERHAANILSSEIKQINFSLHSFLDNFPERNIDEYLNPIFDYCRKALIQKPEQYINFRLWNQKNSSDLFKQNEILLERIEQSFSVEVKRTIDTKKIKSKNLIGRLYLHFDTQFIWPSLNTPFVSRQGHCYGGIKQLAIHADGTVVPCCLDKEANINLGNLKKNSIQEVLSNSRYQHLVNGFNQKNLVEQLCQHCSYRTRFD